MDSVKTLLPFFDLREWKPSWLVPDLFAACAVTAMAIPQGVAYAMIAGLPPVMGLYAGCIPTIIGSLFRSSRHVVTGPTNAVSLLVGTTIAANANLDPWNTALLLSLCVGTIQVAAGALRLGVLVDYISAPVVAGYITGAGILIGVGQLPNLTGSPGVRGNVIDQLLGWGTALHEAQMAPLVIGIATALFIVLVRLVSRKIPTAILALGIATTVTYLAGIGPELGVVRILDQQPVPAGLPALTVPRLDDLFSLIPAAIAATVLSLVESSAVARALASRTGQRLDLSAEFLGQGLANISAAFFGGYPTSGSLARSSINHSSGAQSRLAGVFAGLMMIGTLLVLGPIANYTPIPALAGLLMIVAVDLVDVTRIRRILLGRLGDVAAFLTTMFGTWLLPLDQAIYFGVGVSLVLFLRRARMLVIRRLERSEESGRLIEIPLEDHRRGSSPVCILHIEGQLFFGAAGELSHALDTALEDPDVQVLILRIKRTQSLDITISTLLEATSNRLEASGRTLLLVGLRPDAMRILQRTGIAEKIGEERLFPTRQRWFGAMQDALQRAEELTGQRPYEGVTQPALEE